MNTPLTVSKLTYHIKNQLESNFKEILLQGEISNFKNQQSGHLYFSLKDDFAQISAVMFRGSAIHLKNLPKDGDLVVVKGEISVYEPRGSYQLIIREMFFLGIGALLAKLEELKAKLQKLGWFDSSRKKPLPKFPKKIGVITSPTGAAIQDILNVLSRRYSSFCLILNPVKVQGDGAKEEIAKAIYDMNTFQLADVLIVGRGGGSLEDLWAFNEEIVAKAIFESKIPVISAVGHESDTTLSDLVADLRAPTPSAAAEIVLSEKKLKLDFLIKTKKNLQAALGHMIRSSRMRLKTLERHPLFLKPHMFVQKKAQLFDEINQEIENAVGYKLKQKKILLDKSFAKLLLLKPQNEFIRIRQKISFLDRSIKNTFFHRLYIKNEKLLSLKENLNSLDPKNLLKKGYTILFSENRNSLIISANDVKKEDKISAKLFDGELSLVVNHVRLENEPIRTQ
jgi:exodeoxyribonuclease VII large subunit